MVNVINSYCRIIPGCTWLNEEIYDESFKQPFVMDDFFAGLYQRLGIDYRKFFKMDALSKLGFLASELLLEGIDREQPKPGMGIILFNRSSSLEADNNYQKTIRDKENCFPSPADFVYTLPNIVTGEIAIRNKIVGETAFYVCGRFTTDTTCQMIDSAISAGMKCVLAGWVEVDVFKNTLDCLMMLCTSGKKSSAGSYLPAGIKNILTEALWLNESMLRILTQLD